MPTRKLIPKPGNQPDPDQLPDNEGEMPRDREESENLENVPEDEREQVGATHPSHAWRG